MGLYLLMAAIGWWLGGPVGALLMAACTYPIVLVASVTWIVLSGLWTAVRE